MSLKKRVFRCGCNNAAISIPSVSQGNRTCCQNCTGAPCFYSIMSDCDVWMPNGEWLLAKCTLLRKDCITGCTWSSRWNAGNGSATIDYPAIYPEGCSFTKCQTIPNSACDGVCPYDCFDLTINSFTGNILGGLFGDCSEACYGLDANDPNCLCSGTATKSPPLTIRLNKDAACGYVGYFSCVTASCSPDPYDRLLNDVAAGTIYVAFTDFATILTIVLTAGYGSRSVSQTLQVEFDDVTCYTGSAGTGQPASITGSGYSINVGNDDWTIKTDPNPHTLTATLVPATGCGLSGTAAGYPDVAQVSSRNVQVTLPATPCWWQEEDAQGGACTLAESFFGPCSDNPPPLDRGWTGTAGTAGIENWRKWVLTMNDAGTADSSSLLLRTREGYTATYTATALSCKDPTTFNLASYDSKLRFLPPKLCVIPIESQPPKVCNTGTAQCNCCDDGDLLYVSVVVSGCDGINGTYSGELPRVYDSGSASLPCGVSYPASAPCGVFTLQLGTTGVDDCTVSTIDWSEAVYLVFYCDGTGYSIDVYCWNNDANCWVYQGQGTVTYYECRCYGPLFYFTLPPLDCCCPVGGCPSDPETDFPSLTLTLSSTCADLDGCSIALTYLMGAWTGVATCGSLSVFISVSCQSDGTAWQLVISVPGCPIPNNDTGYTTLLNETVPALTAVWDDYVVAAADAGCCGGVDITIGAVLTS